MNRILIWDAPNMDMALGNFYDRPPVAQERPNMGRLMNWLVQRCGEEDLPRACVFVNIITGRPSNPRFHNWLRYLSTQGYYVFAKPKDDDGSGDVDEDMLKFIREWTNADLREVIIASHDAQCFQEIVTELTSNGVDVLLLGFSEQANGWDDSATRMFMDLQSVPGIFDQPPPRHIDIWSLPAEGQIFEPSGRPRAEPPSRPHRAKRVAPRQTAASLPEAPA